MRKPLAQSCLELLSRLSLERQYRLGNLLALLMRAIPNQVSRQMRENIALCFPEYDRSDRQWLYRESIRQTCYSMAELPAAWCWPPERLLERITRLEVCDEFGRSEKSRIILAPHLGSWETLALWLARQQPTTILYKRRKNRKLDAFIKQARERAGADLVPTRKQGLRKLLIELRSGGSLMILPDQKPSGSKVRVASTFFGLNAPTTRLVYNLCRKMDCDVFIACACRSSPPGNFRLRVEPLEHARLAADETGSAQYMNDSIEQLVRSHREQYLWGYRRFDSSVYQ